MSIAYIFPGQGSQYVGMGKDFFDEYPKAKEIFNFADDVLGFHLSKICFDGPEEELKQTKNTQPAIFLHSLIIWMLLEEFKKINPNFVVAGHSLGEYSALVAANGMSFEDGIKLVRLRGELMQNTGVEFPGTMAAIVGLDESAVVNICKDSEKVGIVTPANFNSPGQIVISGSIEGVKNAMLLAKESGAKLVKELVVSGAFHSPLMNSAKSKLKTALEITKINSISNQLFANVTASVVQDSETIRNLLIEQVTSPVRWEETIKTIEKTNVSSFIEIGPGKVLQGLVKRTSKLQCSGIDKILDFKEFVDQK
ncbi:MAG: ACP S-malonyltransferase [Bacteroidetes bacterium]|nr:ACP S-malonyltransferase [Bacteroidota bacterium]